MIFNGTLIELSTLELFKNNNKAKRATKTKILAPNIHSNLMKIGICMMYVNVLHMCCA